MDVQTESEMDIPSGFGSAWMGGLFLLFVMLVVDRGMVHMQSSGTPRPVSMDLVPAGSLSWT